MTCVAGVVQGGRVYLGADSQVTGAGVRMSAPAALKVFRLGSLLVAGAGPVSELQAARYLEIPNLLRRVEDPLQYVVNVLTRHLRASLSHAGQLDPDGTWNSVLLVGVQGRLFSVGNDFAVVEHTDHAAAGTGHRFALGSLYTTENASSPEWRLRIAIEAACALSTSCGGPITIIAEREE